MDAMGREGYVELYPAQGVRSSPQFFGRPGARIFGCYESPLSAPVAAVLICPPICAEAARNYRREVLLGRELASRGVAVLRFHYRGSGNSDGNSHDITFPTMVDDAALATERLRELAGVEGVAFVGTRLGSLVAATVAAKFDGRPVALWDPVEEPKPYFRDVFRARMLSSVKRGTTTATSFQGLVKELQDVGMVDVCGYPITQALYESSLPRTLSDAIGPNPRSLLIVEMNGRERLRKGSAALIEKWGRAGFRIESHVVTPSEPWWFGASGRQATIEARVTGKRVVSITTEFFTRHLLQEEKG